MNLKTENGISYDIDPTPMTYDDKYYAKLESYIGNDTDIAITEFRITLTTKYAKYEHVLDVGCGTCRFMTAMSPYAYVSGYDVMPETIKRLKDARNYIDPFEHIPKGVNCITFWDSLEHIKYNKMLAMFANIAKNTYILISMPIYKDLTRISESKHYRPDEHLLYATNDGLLTLMANNGFNHIETLDGEILAGREDIYTYVFRKL